MILDTDQDAASKVQDTDQPQSDANALISAKDETIAALRDQLEAERQAHAEARRLLMAALERIPPQLEAPSEARESPETVEEERERGEVPAICGRVSGGRTEAVVEENIYGMTQATWVGALAGVGALVFAYLAWRVSKRELGLAQQQAELRPHLVASLNTVAFHDLPPDTLVPHEQAAVVFDITNNGRTAAHGVRCEFRLEGPLGAPDPSMGENLDFEASYTGPKQTIPHTVRVSVYSYGSATARYSCICDEVGESEGVVEFEVRHTDPQ